MKIKKGLKDSTEDFWYDLTDGGYLRPREMCQFILDAEKVERAIAVILDFKESCEKAIKGFIQ